MVGKYYASLGHKGNSVGYRKCITGVVHNGRVVIIASVISAGEDIKIRFVCAATGWKGIERIAAGLVGRHYTATGTVWVYIFALEANIAASIRALVLVPKA